MKTKTAFIIVFLLVSIPAAFIAGETVCMEWLAREHLISVPGIPVQFFHAQKEKGNNDENKISV